MSENLVRIGSFSNAAEARLLLNALEEAGVRAFLSGEMTAGFMADLGTLGPQVVLHVAPSELKRARDILNWLGESAALPDDWEEAESDAEVWRCASCGEAVEAESERCPYCEAGRP